MVDPLADLARLEGVPSAVQAARDAVDVVLRDRGLRWIDDETRARARWSAVLATTELAETDLAAPDAWADPPGTEQLRTGALRLYAELEELAGSIRRTPPQVLARAHALLGRGLIEDEALGRVADPEAVARLSALAGLLTSTTAAPVPVLAAVAHAEIASIGPFGFGDGMIARAVERMVLLDGGVDPPGMIITEAGHLRAGAGYRHLLAGYASGRAVGMRDWLLHAMQALVHGAEVSPAARRS